MTYQVHLDFAFARANLEYRTVDIDFGCCVIRTRSVLGRVGGWWRTSRKRNELIAEWHAPRNDSDKTLNFLESYKTLLCNLRSLDDSFNEEGRAQNHSN